MDSSAPAPLVNGELLGRYVGRKVRAVIQFMRNDSTAVIGRSTDERQLVVRGSPPFQLTTFFEVVGVADSQSSICAYSWTNFGDTFDLNRCPFSLENTEFDHFCVDSACSSYGKEFRYEDTFAWGVNGSGGSAGLVEDTFAYNKLCQLTNGEYQHLFL